MLAAILNINIAEDTENEHHAANNADDKLDRKAASDARKFSEQLHFLSCCGVFFSAAFEML
jgi:hypothetical protein